MTALLPTMAFAALSVWLTVWTVNRLEVWTTRASARRKLTVLVVLLAAVYNSGYVVARCRRFIVMQGHLIKEEALVVRHTVPGIDFRNDWRGRLKNRVNPLVFYFFLPLCAAEDFVRGGERTLR